MAPDEDVRILRELTAREQQVLSLTAEGYTSREIGQRLAISPKTVDTYRARVTGKLGCDHRSGLVQFALRTGLLREAPRLSGSPAPSRQRSRTRS